jgi:DNA-binding CsgD family transcriptional regulator
MAEPDISYYRIDEVFRRKVNGSLATSILDKMDILIAVIEVETFRPVWVNNYAAKRLGYTSNEILNLSSDGFKSLFQPCFQHRIENFMNRPVFVSNREPQIYMKVQTRNKEWVSMLASSAEYGRKPDGSVEYLLVMGTEIDVIQTSGHIPSDIEPEQSGNQIHGLSNREKSIVELIADCKTDKEIAALLHISVHTAKTHRKRIIHKLGLKNSRSLIKLITEQGLLPDRSVV